MIGEVIFHAIGAVVDFFAAGKLDYGLRKHFWLRVIFLAVLAIAIGLTVGSLLRVVA